MRFLSAAVALSPQVSGGRGPWLSPQPWCWVHAGSPSVRRDINATLTSNNRMEVCTYFSFEK